MPYALRRLPLILACLAAFAPALLQAQGPVRPGERVRVLAPSTADSLIVGRVVALDSTSLLLAPAPSGGSLRLPVAGIQQLEVSRGRGRSTLQGALLGTGIGAAASYAVVHASVRESSCDYLCGAAEAGGAILGGTAGLVVGALIGNRSRGPERWQRVPLSVVRTRP